MNFSNEQKQLLQKFGTPYKQNLKSLKVDPFCLVELFRATGRYVYIAPLQIFEQYNENTGLWESISEDALFWRLSNFAADCGRSLGIQDVNFTLSDPTLCSILHLFRSSISIDAPLRPDGTHCIHLKNSMLVYNPDTGTFEKQPFSPSWNSHNRINLEYNPNAPCERFLHELLIPMQEYKSGIDVIQLYFGQCLLKENLSQTFLILSGEAECGKSVLVSVIEQILGLDNVAELHPDRLENPFEITSYSQKSLLTAKDVPSDALSINKINSLKSMTGNDLLSGEQKHKNARVSIRGNFNVIVTGNADITVNFGNSRDSFERRILCVTTVKPKNFKRITQFEDVLLQEESEGILAWAVEGARKLLQAGGKIEKSKEQKDLVNYLLDESTAVDTFVRKCVVPIRDSFITTEKAIQSFYKFANGMRWNNIPMTPTKVSRDLHTAMMIHRPDCPDTTNIKVPGSNTSVRGYLHCDIIFPE